MKRIRASNSRKYISKTSNYHFYRQKYRQKQYVFPLLGNIFPLVRKLVITKIFVPSLVANMFPLLWNVVFTCQNILKTDLLKKFVTPPVRNVFPLLVAIIFTFSTGRKYVSTTGSNYFYVQKYVFLVFLHFW